MPTFDLVEGDEERPEVKGLVLRISMNQKVGRYGQFGAPALIRPRVDGEGNVADGTLMYVPQYFGPRL